MNVSEEWEKGYKKGQIDMFNRLYEASVEKTADDIEVCYLVFRELNKIKEELSK